MTRRAAGFSLIELMVAVTILAILVAVGVPSFRDWMNNARIRTAAEGIQNGLRVARNEAAQRGVPVRFELTSATAGRWQVCQLGPTDTACQATTILDRRDGSEAGLSIAASTSANKQTTASIATALTGGVPAGITYTALGRPSSFGAGSIARIDIYGASTAGRRQVLIVSSGGMVRMCDPASTLSSSDAQSCGTN